MAIVGFEQPTVHQNKQASLAKKKKKITKPERKSIDRKKQDWLPKSHLLIYFTLASCTRNLGILEGIRQKPTLQIEYSGASSWRVSHFIFVFIQKGR